MASTFFGLTIAYSGLNASQAQITTTANNISNLNTEGYSRQKVNVVASSALRAYQRFGTTSTGVEVESVTQVRDRYYDEKYWNNQTNLGFYERKNYYMTQIESYFTESGQTGFSTLFAGMFNDLDTLKTNSGDAAVRNQFISSAEKLTTYFNSISTKLSDLQTSINDEIKTTVAQINAYAEKIAVLNKQINVIEVEGGHANELRDQRAMLVDELSQIVPVEINESQVQNSNHPDMKTGATYYSVKINGQYLVDNQEYHTLTTVMRDKDHTDNLSDIDGLYDIEWTEGGSFKVTGSNMSGSLKAMFEVRDGNNAENLKGVCTETGTTSITISRPTVNDIMNMNMPAKGFVTINSTKIPYSSFDIKTDDDGNITEYTFNLDRVLTTDDRLALGGKQAVIGSTVDYMGIPYYQNQMNTFLRSFTQAFNDLQKEGLDLNGDPMGAFFVAKNKVSGEEVSFDDAFKAEELNSLSSFYYQLTAANVGVAKATHDDPRILATTRKDVESFGVDKNELVDDLLKLENRTVLFRGGGADTFLQCIYADVTVDTQECEVFEKNYINIKETIENQRMSISGVDEDEEALDLIKFQNAYNLASKCISVFSQIYDRLILNTGV